MIEELVGKCSNKNKPKTAMYCLTQQQKNEIINDCGAKALILYEFYLEYLHQLDLSDDSIIARKLPFSKRTIQDTRLRLKKHNYYHNVKISSNNKLAVFNYLGREMVVRKRLLPIVFQTDDMYRISKMMGKAEALALVKVTTLSEFDKECTTTYIQENFKDRKKKP